MLENSAELLRRCRSGDNAAAEAIYQRYAERLLALARSRLSPKLARRVDADDVVQSTYRSFFVRAREGQFTVDEDGDLWRLLATITLHKLGRQAKRHRAARRSLDREAPDADGVLLAELAAREPSPADVVAAAEELHWLMSQLDSTHRQAVQLRLQGLTIGEVAAAIGRSERTVRRWLAEAKQLLEERWSNRSARAGEDDQVRQSQLLDEMTADIDAPLQHADYHLERLIGSGGMCKVYVATEKCVGRRVTVKVLRKRLRREPQIVQRFLNEARVVARFSHPHIVPVHGLGRLPRGGYFMVMDFVDGEDLARVCQRGPIASDRAAAIVATVAEAIQHAHDRGVIHRDLKPGNVLVDRQGKVFVSDFGFAWLQSAGPQDDAIVGTAGFMAPEQIDPRWGQIGPHTDVYGLGALLFMLVTGQPPFAGATTSEILERVIAQRDEGSFQGALQHVPEALRAICDKCLQQNPSNRFATAQEVALALKVYIEDPK